MRLLMFLGCAAVVVTSALSAIRSSVLKGGDSFAVLPLWCVAWPVGMMRRLGGCVTFCGLRVEFWCVSLSVLCGLLTGLTSADDGELSVPVGVWGGAHIRLQVTETGATLEFDCAMGRIETPLRRTPEGHFEAPGLYVFEPGGPRRFGDPAPPDHPAHYEGWTDGQRMRLRVTLVQTGRQIGVFDLTLGEAPRLEKCL